jgi:hypothetical protein
MLIYKLLSGVAAVAMSAAVALLVLPAISPEVEARTPPRAVKGDRLDIRPIGPACKEQAWPYYDASCLRDRSKPGGQARVVRMVSTDRR